MGRIYIALALVVLAGIGALWIHHDGVNVGLAKCEAEHVAAAEKAQAEQDRRSTASSAATTNMLDYLAANLPPIETTTHEAIERVRVVYRIRPMPAVCELDGRVRDELEAARVRANTPGR
jgi:hypothetical protein